ncbi:hypothetical protein HN587_01110 [Candidatus Woesearchaeota archaeon]|jgi:hypothetical protein|nr:hypothetical protein [Candidatus Woesearchaeota archaeon]
MKNLFRIKPDIELSDIVRGSNDWFTQQFILSRVKQRYEDPRFTLFTENGSLVETSENRVAFVEAKSVTAVGNINGFPVVSNSLKDSNYTYVLYASNVCRNRSLRSWVKFDYNLLVIDKSQGIVFN